jgi:hypothetical protein
MVVTSYPLRAILHNSNATGNIAKWAIELAGFQLDFQPLQRHQKPSPEVRAPVFTRPHWTLFFDGSARNKKAGAGVVLIDPNGEQVKYMVLLDFEATNNMAEYEALIFGLTVALSLGVRELLVKGDSQLIIRQVRGSAVATIPSSQHTSSM